MPVQPSSGARRSPALWIPIMGLLTVAVAGAAVVGARQSPSPSSSAARPIVTTRAVALGDSVPYGHGLANPYLTPQVGLPPGAVSQGPSTLAYPTRVASALRLTMTVRPTNCRLVGDQLAISGAVADPADNTARDGQCPHPPQQARNLDDELAAADLARHPARLVLLQDGADDIQFARCLEYQLAEVEGVHLGLGTQCVDGTTVTPALAAQLADVRTSLARAIETVAPHAGTVAVLDYYQPVPSPAQITEGNAVSGLSTNLVCAGIKSNAAATYAAAQLVLSALNGAISGAVADARLHHVRNVVLVDVSHAVDGHAICTADPWIFSGEPVPDTTLAADTEHILAARACGAAGALHVPCGALSAEGKRAEASLIGYVWRAAHPNAAGQRALAAVAERDLRGRVATVLGPASTG